MNKYSLTHLADSTLLSNLAALVARDRTNTAAMLAHLAEVESRRLYAQAGYSSLQAYCVGVLRFSEDAASRRTRAARAARKFPVLFDMVADGRLHLSAVGLIAPRLSHENADDLLAAAAHKNKSEIESMLARRFPQSDLMTWIAPVAPDTRAKEDENISVPGRIKLTTPEDVEPSAAETSLSSVPRRTVSAAERPRVAPLSAERFALQVTIGLVTYDNLRQAQALLSHQLPLGDVEGVLDRALALLVRHLEKRRFASTTAPRKPRPRATPNPRTISAEVRRAVRRRDGNQCTFVSADGHCCGARHRLEFDHIVPVAQGGSATVANIRLLCWTHNHLEAERAFGLDFMREKREQARRAKAQASAQTTAAASTAAAQAAVLNEAPANDPAAEITRDILAGLRELGVRGDKARCAAEYAESAAEPTLEARMRAALRFICPSMVRTGMSAAASAT